MSEQELCLFRLPDGSVVCTSCDHPPENSEYLEAAPEGTPQGKVKAYPIPLNEG